MSVISFSKLVSGSRGVRVTNDRLVWAVQLTEVVTGKDNDVAGCTLRTLKPDIFDHSKFIHRHLAENRGKKTRLLSIHDAIELTLVLPGRMAKQFRVAICDILTRFLEGDMSLVQEIQHNKEIGTVAACNTLLNQTLTDRKRKLDSELPEYEYVYCTESKAFPGLLKIGHTKDMASRLSTLNTGCAPDPHVVMAMASTFNGKRDERMAHAFFADQREEGEFFRVSVAEVQAFFDRHITSQYNSELMRST